MPSGIPYLTSFPLFPFLQEVTVDVIIDTSEVMDVGETKSPIFLGEHAVLVSNCCNLSSNLSFLLSKTLTRSVRSENFDCKAFNF